MTACRIVFYQLFLSFCALIFSMTAAFAACSDDTTFEKSDFWGFGTARAQLGLRTALGTGPTSGLIDGEFGPVTQTAMHDLCDLVPRPEGLDDKLSTLDVLREFIALGDGLGQIQISDTELHLGGQPNAQALALATVPQVTVATLLNRENAFDCGQLDRALDGSAYGQRAMATLGRIFDDQSPNEICAMFAAPDDPVVLRGTFERLGHINTTRPGALQVLASNGFRNWVAADKTARLRRLVASEAAVIALVDDYNTGQGAVSGGTPYISSSCTTVPVERTNTYYMLTKEDIASISLLISVTPVLATFAEENPSYDSAGALWRDLEPVIQQQLGDCILPEIAPLVTGSEHLAKSYSLQNGAVERLSALSPLADSADILTAFQERSFPTKSEFLNALKQALTTSATADVDALIEQAAETVAATSEPATPNLDIARVDIPDEDRLTTPDAAQIIVTQAADDAVASIIDDPNLNAALQGATITPVPVPEQIKTQVRNSLQDAARVSVAASVEEQIALIEPAVVSSWGLSQPLADAITAVPYVRAAMVDATGADLNERLAPLIGIEYPTYRLFHEALQNVSNAENQSPFSNFVTEQITMIATKSVRLPRITREFGPIAIDDCNCVAERNDPHLRVYGFYPFWFAPLPANELNEGEEPEPQRTVDFSTTTDIAFYGLEFTYDNDTIILNNRAQWRAGRRDFINSAHQFRARVDLAFDMRDWKKWDASAVTEVVDHIVREMSPFERIERFTPTNIKAAIPTLFDPTQPDGVTLIFPDYIGHSLTEDEAEQLIGIIKAVYEGLPNRDVLNINVAFDFPLFGKSLNAPLLNELHDLLVEKEYVVSTDPDQDETGTLATLRRSNEKVIDKILLFLERPTSNAKKELRLRVERSDFQGENRQEVLRSIIPVLPPGGHKDVLTSIRADTDPSEQPEPFSQFKDDLVYFKDNFSGVGFWSVPHASSPEAAQLAQRISKEFGVPDWPRPFSGLQAPIAGICNFICPNRAIIMLSTLAAFSMTLLLVREAYYVGWAHRVAYRMFYFFGVVPLMNVIILLTLFALWQCDPQSWLPVWLFSCFAIALGTLWLYNSYQRIKNGPKP